MRLAATTTKHIARDGGQQLAPNLSGAPGILDWHMAHGYSAGGQLGTRGVGTSVVHLHLQVVVVEAVTSHEGVLAIQTQISGLVHSAATNDAALKLLVGDVRDEVLNLLGKAAAAHGDY
jgi:hypothetical protein